MKINVNNITLNYVKEGEGAPLILLHGNGEDHHIFDRLAEKLKKHFTIYAIDSRNHGDSEQTDDYSYEAMAEDVYRFVRKTGLSSVSVIGFSDGAIISLLLAMKHKTIFDKMVWLGINLKPADFKKDFYRWMENEYEKNKDPLIKMMLEQPSIELKDLEAVSVPVLVVAGQYDLFYRKMFKDIVKTIPDATLKIMQGHDHASYVADSDVLYPVLREFFFGK